MYNFFREKSIYYLPAISSSKLSRRSFCFIFSTSSGVILSLEVKTLTANLIFCQVVSVARALFNVIWIGRSPRWTTHPGISLASLNALLFLKGKKIFIQGNTRSGILAVVFCKLWFHEIFTSTTILINLSDKKFREITQLRWYFNPVNFPKAVSIFPKWSSHIFLRHVYYLNSPPGAIPKVLVKLADIERSKTYIRPCTFPYSFKICIWKKKKVNK